MGIKAVVVGYGPAFGMGALHANQIKSTDGLELYGICDIDASAREKARKEQPGAKIFEHIDEVLTDPEANLAVLVTPHDTHAPLAIKVMDSGRHCVVEKPMCLNTAEADAMIAAARRNKVMLSVYQNRRWDSDYLTVKKAIEEGLLGEVFLIESCVDRWGEPVGWRRERKHGGGMLYDWGAHLIDQVVQIAKSEPNLVFAELEHRVWQVDTETFAKVLVNFKNGLWAEIETGSISWIPKPRWHIRGERGALIQEGWDKRPKIKAKVGGLTCDIELEPIKADWGDYYRNISAYLNKGEVLLVKPEDVRTSIKIIEAAFKSGELGEAVRVE